MKYHDIVIVKRWIPILEEYERTKTKVNPRPFKFVKDLCKAHHISKKELCRYYRKWQEGGKTDESLLPVEGIGPFPNLKREVSLRGIQWGQVPERNQNRY